MISDTYDVSLSIENAFQNIDRLDLCKYVISSTLIFEYVNQNEYVDLTFLSNATFHQMESNNNLVLNFRLRRICVFGPFHYRNGGSYVRFGSKNLL